MVLSTQKKIISVLALGLSAVLLFGSTFAWQSLNQEALNYVRGGANPGGRLHDDFNNITFQTNADGSAKFTTKTFDKDVYVENFTSLADDGVNIYARVRLDEYMEYGPNAGTTDNNAAVTVLGDSDAKLTNTDTWTTRIPGETSVFDAYWKWEMGGQTTYMPTFNKNKDSLAADVNGTFDNGFADYVDYSDEKYGEGGDGRTAYAIYDADNNTADELTKADVNELIKKGTAAIPEDADWAGAIRLTQETHTAKKSLDGRVMMMAEYLEKMETDEDFDGRGNFWVWDTDGWAYWANPIQPQTATGLLLDQIQRTGKTIGSGEDEWYYGINVVAQFITADDLGEETNTGFYDPSKGEPPTENARALLEAIGVNTGGESGADLAMLETETVAAGDESELRLALENGSEQITLTDDIALNEPLVVAQNTCVYLNGCSITPGGMFDGQALFTVVDGAWLDFDDEGLVQAPDDGYAVRVEDDGLLYIWDGTFIGGAGAIYVRSGEAVIVDGTFCLGGAEGQLLDWRSGDGEITVYRGTFYDFDPSNVNGKSLLQDGYTVRVESNGGETVYTVTADTLEPLPEEPVLPDEALPGDGEAAGDENSGASADIPENDTDVPEDSAPSIPDGSVNESAETGALSGISGKADVVEPMLPNNDNTETAAGSDGADENTAQSASAEE